MRLRYSLRVWNLRWRLKRLRKQMLGRPEPSRLLPGSVHRPERGLAAAWARISPVKRNATLLVLLLLQSVLSPAQQSPEKVRREATKALEKNSRVTVELRDGRKQQGQVSETAAEYFVLLSDGRSSEVRYDAVQKLKRHGTSERKRALVAIGVTAGILGLLIGGVAAGLD